MKVFFSIHGVQESIEILKNPYLSEISPFLLLQNFFKRYAMLMLGHEYIACIVIHQTKPKCVVVQHAKGFQDWSTYKADTRHVKIERNFWTHCIFGLLTLTANKCRPWSERGSAHCGPTLGPRRSVSSHLRRCRIQIFCV